MAKDFLNVIERALMMGISDKINDPAQGGTDAGDDVTQSSGELYGIGFMIHLITDKESKITVSGNDYKQRRLMNWLMSNIANALNDIDWDTYKEEELEIIERHVLAWNDIGHMGQLQWYGATCRMSVTFLNKR